MRRLRSFGLLTTMALAIAALGASSASASGFVAEKYPSTVEGAAGGMMVITTNNFNLNCGSSLGLTGSAIGSPETLTTEFASKEIPCGGGATITPNGCKLVLHPGSEASKNEFGGTFEFAPECTMKFNYFGCTTTVSPQTGLGASYVNSGEGKSRSVAFSASATGIKYTSVGTCPGGAGTYSNATLTGSWNVKSSSSGTQYGIWVANPTGLFLTSGKDGERPLAFRAEQYPAGVTNQWTTQFKFLTGFGAIFCDREKIGGVFSEATWALQMTRAAEYKACRIAGAKATMTSNGCSTYYTLSSGSPYFGYYVLSCPSGKQLEVKSAECAVQIPPQQLGDVEYEETGSGASQKVLTQIAGEGVEYTVTAGGFLCEEGSYEDGSVEGAATLEAVG